MRILLVVTGLGMGGAEKVVVQLADCLVRRGHVVAIASLGGGEGVTPLDERAKVWRFQLVDGWGRRVREIRRLSRSIKNFDPDVVNSHLFHANLLVRVLRVFVSMRRVVSSAHNTHEGSRLRMFLFRWTDWLSDESTNVSAEAVSAFEAASGARVGRMRVISNGVDTVHFSYDEASRDKVREELCLGSGVRLILAVGRLFPEKDYPNLLSALASLADDSCWQLAVAGVGPDVCSLKLLAAEVGIADRVRWLGMRDDIAALMCACDLFVLSSATEGLPLVLLEAMASSRPVVATDCGGIRAALGKSGFLVPPGDANALSHALSRILRLTDTERAALGSAGRRRVIQEYSIENMADKYLGIYRRAV